MARKTKSARPAAASLSASGSAALDFARQAASLAADTRCHGVVLLDVSTLSPITDYFVIATGTSGRQMRAVADQLIDAGKEVGYKAAHVDGYDSAAWILVDFVDVVVHVFSQDARHYYDLENLWGDARKIELPAAGK
jgi:ribosome-associated protein